MKIGGREVVDRGQSRDRQKGGGFRSDWLDE